MRAHGGGNRILEVGRQIVECSADGAAKPARRQPTLADRLVDRDDAADLQRLRSLLLCTVFAALRRIAQNFELWLYDLQLVAALVFFNLAVECDHLTRLELVAQVSCVEPHAAQARPSLSHRELENRHTARTEKSGVAYFTDDSGHLAGAQLGNSARVQPVFVAKGQIMEQIADTVDPLAGQNLRDAGTDALYIFHRSGEFEHASRVPGASQRSLRQRETTKSKRMANQGGQTNGSRIKPRLARQGNP